jgi:hypothetical protein
MTDLAPDLDSTAPLLAREATRLAVAILVSDLSPK